MKLTLLTQAFVALLVLELNWAASTPVLADSSGSSADAPAISTIDGKEIAVWPPGGIAGKPLLIVVPPYTGESGSDYIVGKGPEKNIKEKNVKGAGKGKASTWLKLAQQNHFTIVSLTCTYTQDYWVPSHYEPYFSDTLNWIQEFLQYDKDNVFMTGHFAGGYPVWLLATKRPDFFKGLFFENSCFAPDYIREHDYELSQWRGKSIMQIYSNDKWTNPGGSKAETIYQQNQKAAEFLKSQDSETFVSQVNDNLGEGGHPDLVVNWMEQIVNSHASSSPPAVGH